MKKIALWSIHLYQRTLSRILPTGVCRFTPSCSHYAYEAIDRFGVMRGGMLAVRRILRCQPFYQGDSHDPVPERL